MPVIDETPVIPWGAAVHRPADPDARISLKPSKACAFKYLGSMDVDEGHEVISHVQADFADQRDCTLLPRVVVPRR